MSQMNEDPSPSNVSCEGNVPAESKCNNSIEQKHVTDFLKVKEIGEGTYGTVYLVKEKATGNEYAMKACLKVQILKEKMVDYVHREKNILAKLSTKELNHFSIIKLYATFQDADSLYFLLQYAKYGDLYHVMMKKEMKKFNLEETLYYSACLLSALKHLHSLRILHRDVKPENMLVLGDGRVALSDFGSAKDLTAPQRTTENSRRRRRSFVGTPEFVSPEMLEGAGEVTEAADIWSFAVTLYQFLTGKHAFHAPSEYLVMKRVTGALFTYPDDFDYSAKTLIEKILIVEVDKRLKLEEIEADPFFQTINWTTLPTTQPPTIELSPSLQ